MIGYAVFKKLEKGFAEEYNINYMVSYLQKAIDISRNRDYELIWKWPDIAHDNLIKVLGKVRGILNKLHYPIEIMSPDFTGQYGPYSMNVTNTQTIKSLENYKIITLSPELKKEDLKNNGEDEEKALWHFANYGIDEGRQGNKAFNVYTYKGKYADLQAAYGNNIRQYYTHYMYYGKNEGRTAEKISTVYTVTFKVNGQTVKTETVEYGHGATAPSNIGSKRYFTGWDKDYSCITKNLEVNAESAEVRKRTVKVVRTRRKVPVKAERAQAQEETSEANSNSETENYSHQNTRYNNRNYNGHRTQNGRRGGFGSMHGEMPVPTNAIDPSVMQPCGDGTDENSSKPRLLINDLTAMGMHELRDLATKLWNRFML